MNGFPGKIARRCAKVIQKFRIVYYAALPNDDPFQGTLIKRHPLLLVGKGSVVIKGSGTVGNFPSPFFFNTYAHFDLRQNNARIEIGDNSVIGGGSMVIDSIPPNVIAAGVPCKIINAL